MSVVFRCDAGTEFGLGHLSRCMVLANSLLRKGVSTRFVIHGPESIYKKIIRGGHQIHILNNAINDYEDPSQWIDNAKFALLDSPKISEDYVKKIASIAKVGFFDDDIARDYDVDLIINNHLWANISDYTKKYRSRYLLLGSKFNTVDPDFFNKVQERHCLLLTMGGEDPHNVTSLIIRELAKIKIDMPIVIIVGPSHPRPDDVTNDVKKYLPLAKLYYSPDSLVSFMKIAHIAITAGGTTCYELAASKIPFAVFALEQSQIKLSQTMVKFGLGVSIGSYNDFNGAMLSKALNKIGNKENCNSIINAGSKLYPRSGVDFITDTLLKIYK